MGTTTKINKQARPKKIFLALEILEMETEENLENSEASREEEPNEI